MSHRQVIAHAIFHIIKPQIAQPAIGLASRSNPNFHFCPPSQHPFTAPLPQPSKMLSSSVTHPSVSSFYMSHWPRSSLHLGCYIYFLPLRSAHHLGSLRLCLIPPSQMGIFLSSALITCSPCSLLQGTCCCKLTLLEAEVQIHIPSPGVPFILSSDFPAL